MAQASARRYPVVFLFIIVAASWSCAMSWDADGDAYTDGVDGGPCSGVFCGGHGMCVSTDDGPRCLCDDGYVEVGLTCVPVPEDCGNGSIDPDEECDGINLGGKTCESLGYGPGDLACLGNCTIDASDCGGGGSCGDDVCAAPEETSCTCPADCDPCAGCCDGGLCLAGTNDSACGSSGTACEECTGDATCTGGACLAGCGNDDCDGGETQCTCPEDCGDCPGCCQAAECRSGTDETACGRGGAVCDVCSSSESCTGGSCAGGCGNGVCGSGETECNCADDCGSCAGCCEASACRPGNSDDECGSGGDVCDECVSGERCSGGSCLGGCGNGVCGSGETECNCPEDCGSCSGCCSASSCMGGTSDTACGRGGADCEACAGGRVCQTGTCVCSSNDHKACYDDDVYWFDSCGTREDKDEECGSYGCSDGACNASSCDGDSYESNDSRAAARYLGAFSDGDDESYYVTGADISPPAEEDWYYALVTDAFLGVLNINVSMGWLTVDVDLCVTAVCVGGTTTGVTCDSPSDTAVGTDTCCSRQAGTVDEWVYMNPSCSSGGDYNVYIQAYGYASSEQCNYYLGYNF